MALSMSVSAGAHNARHNTDLAYRANLRNVDADLSVGNISIRDVPIAEAYETVFGDSLRAYNAKQKSKGHPERCIGDYLSKIEKAYSDDSARVKSGNKGRVNVPKPCYEYVLQIGNRDTFGGELDQGIRFPVCPCRRRHRYHSRGIPAHSRRLPRKYQRARPPAHERIASQPLLLRLRECSPPSYNGAATSQKHVPCHARTASSSPSAL